MSWQRPNIGSRVTREGHARFWERPEVKFLRATRQTRRLSCLGMSASPPTSDVWLRRSELALRADFVEKVASLKWLQICQNTNDIFD